MKTFEELPVWLAGRDLVRRVYATTRTAPFRNDSGLCDQIQRAAVSITSNIAEGHERGTTPDLIQFLFYAKGSAGEVRSQLYNAEDLGYVRSKEAEALRDAARAVSRQISAWIQAMQTSAFKQGPKFHKERAPDPMKRIFEERGLVRMPDGRFRKTTENGITENGNPSE